MIEAVLIGVAAGVIGGMFGVGGGTLFVPALTIFLGLSHIEAEATSLLAIILVALVGAWRQRAYGNLRVADGVTVGVLAIAGAVLGVVLANALPERALELGFAALLVVVAGQMTHRALRAPQAAEDAGAPAAGRDASRS